MLSEKPARRPRHILKLAIFIDGTWLQVTSQKHDLSFDFGKLEPFIVKRIRELTEIDAIYCSFPYFYANIAVNADPADLELVARRQDFHSMLRQRFNFIVHAFEIDFKGNRIRLEDRGESDFCPVEKEVDVALTVDAMALVTGPNPIDIVAFVIGDRDFVPLLRRLNGYGIQTAVFSIEGACSEIYWRTDRLDMVKSLPITWLDQHLDELSLKNYFEDSSSMPEELTGSQTAEPSASIILPAGFQDFDPPA